MFDFAWSEMALIGVVALVVIGPKDLPRVLRTAGVMMRRARGMAREFQNSIDDMIREAELDEFRKEVNETRRHLEQAAHVDLGIDADRMLPTSGPIAPDSDEQQLDLGLDQPRHSEPRHLHYAGSDQNPMSHDEAAEPSLPFDHGASVTEPTRSQAEQTPFHPPAP